MTSQPTPLRLETDCWNRIGVHGDRSCPELTKVGHCHHCPVFAGAGRRFLTAAPPPGYLQEWADRLAAPPDAALDDLLSVLTFRLGEEWLALPVAALVEVTTPRPVHRVPHRRGLLAGLVNIRGELYLCVHLDQLLGIRADGVAMGAGHAANGSPTARLLVTEWAGERWVFPVAAVDQVRRVSRAALAGAPPTVALAAAHLSAAVFRLEDRVVGLLDTGRVFQSLRGKVR
jgi:chemotaxis-related protein WspD